MAKEDPSTQATARGALPVALTDHLVFLLRLAAEEAHNAAQQALASLGIRGAQYGLLLLLDEAEVGSQQDAARRLMIDRTVMVSLLDDLEDRRLVERRRSLVDRRRHALYLTAAGRRLLQRAAKAVAAAEDDFFAPLDAGEREVLRSFLLRLDAHADRRTFPETE